MTVTRYAPSPTWLQHIWGIRTALYCRLLARKEGGKFKLRIEDTDQARGTKLFEEGILDSLRRFGLERDAGPDKDDGLGPYYQMQRLELYNQYLQQLLDADQAYYARETAAELEAMREQAYAAKKPFNYKRQTYTDAQLAQYKDEWRIPTIRFEIPADTTITFVDQVKGETMFEMNGFGDFVIMKGDGSPMYNFSNVIDDHLHEVTNVMRGEEHLSNTPKQILLYNAFGREPPQFAHLSLMLNPHNGKKMSKRDTDIWLTLVPQFRDAWFLPEAIINFIALLGRNPGTEQEFFTMDELIEAFSMDRVQKSNAIYDFKRALWFNSEYIKRMEDEEFVTRVKDFLTIYGGEEWKEIVESEMGKDTEYRMTFAPYIKMRIQTWKQFEEHCQYFFVRPAYVDPEIVNRAKMKVTQEIVNSFLPDLIHLLEHLTPAQWTEETIKEELLSFIKAKELKNGQVLRPVRAILTGVEASPGAFEMLYVLGQEESLVRLQAYKEQ